MMCQSILYIMDRNMPLNVRYLIYIRVVFIEIAAYAKTVEVENLL